MTAPLAVLVGDPRGVGPEVMCRALAERAAAGDPVRAVLVGDAAAIATWSARWQLPPVNVVEPPGDEPVEVRAIRWAVAAALGGEVAGLVTGPIHKARLAATGFRHHGHTDFLAHLCGVQRPVMAFVGGELRVALVTVHIPLRAVPDALTTQGVLHVVRTAATALREDVGLAAARIAVCGLNPHAGDDGLLGHEDAAVVRPAVQAAQAEGIDAYGPVSAEAAFLAARRGQADLVVAMYHDQGLAPLKAVDFGRCVNWTLGLPIVRTSVDHGTADDIAGQGRADPSSAHAALRWAETLVGRR